MADPLCPNCKAPMPPSVARCPSCKQARETPDPYVGKVLLGKYRCMEKVASGATSSVYKVQHAKLQLIRAMKILKPELAGNPKAVEAFWREGRTAAPLRDPHLVILHDIDALPDATPCSIWEFVEGITLRTRVEEALEFYRQRPAAASTSAPTLPTIEGAFDPHSDQSVS